MGQRRLVGSDIGGMSLGGASSSAKSEALGGVGGLRRCDSLAESLSRFVNALHFRSRLSKFGLSLGHFGSQLAALPHERVDLFQ